MKNVKSSDLRKLSEEELKKELDEAREGLLKLRFQKVVDEMNDTSVIRKTRRKIARIKTILHERVPS
ncbi:50S ribosomal protein L29 [Candidatus Uabimicrobium sp. HlEnr_7]|uniref:50S ribosomal protein L29 n=1 Tax=Candidatus Uabimicrobium helgolandensis TaxID=3095367 RepID=UPI003558990B